MTTLRGMPDMAGGTAMALCLINRIGMLVERGDLAAALREAGAFSGADYPICAAIVPVDPRDFEEDFADEAVWGMGALPKDKHLMPWRIEDELRKLGANFVRAGRWQGFAVRDANLITGQQNFSGAETARLVIETLGR